MGAGLRRQNEDSTAIALRSGSALSPPLPLWREGVGGEGASRAGRGPGGGPGAAERALALNDALLLLAQALDAEPHGLAGLEEYRRRLLAGADAGRRPRGDDVARIQHEE